MNQLTQADQQSLVSYGIGSVIDLRMGWEIADAPNVFSRSQLVNFYNHDFWGDRFDTYRSGSRGAAPEKKLADLYCSGLVKSGFIMADIMGTIADSADSGFAFQCRSGKDRTGLVAAILLAIAGVCDETICADYALSSSFLKSPEPDAEVDPKQPGYYLKGCAPETMAFTLGFLKEEYSSIEGYLRQLDETEYSRFVLISVLLSTQVCPVHFGVVAVLRNQLVMATHLDNTFVFDHSDHFGAHRRCQSVRDNDGGSTV